MLPRAVESMSNVHGGAISNQMRTRSVGEQRPEFGCFGSILLRGEHLTYRLCVPRDHLPNRMRLATLTSIGMSLPPSSRCRVQRL